MQKEETDLRDRTKVFALGVVRMFSALPTKPRRKCLESSCSSPELQSALTIVKRFARGAKLNGATAEERHRRKSREVAVSESGDERINSSRNAAIRCGRSKNGARWVTAT
jgi:hypothetical protein